MQPSWWILVPQRSDRVPRGGNLLLDLSAGMLEQCKRACTPGCTRQILGGYIAGGTESLAVPLSGYIDGGTGSLAVPSTGALLGLLCLSQSHQGLGC